MKLCQIYNCAAHYRKSLFLLMDREFCCDYVFGESLGDIKQMDTSVLRGRVTKVKNSFLCKRFYWQPGVQKLLCGSYDAFLVLGDTRCLSTWLFCLRAKMLGCTNRIYFWTHGWYGKETKTERWLKKKFFAMAGGGIFLYGNYARELMIKEGFDSSKLHVIHNSLAYENQLTIRRLLCINDIYQKYFGNECKNLIFVGRLTKEKRLDLVIKAMAFLKKQGIVCNLTLIGEGKVREELEKLIKNLGLNKNVWFYGACYDEQQLGCLIYNADLCASPGNVGLTAMHAMVYGTPVITHNDYSHQGPEFEAIHNGETGTFFQHGDAVSLANCIKHWFDEKSSKREEVRQACYKEIDTQWTPQFQMEVLKKVLS